MEVRLKRIISFCSLCVPSIVESEFIDYNTSKHVLLIQCVDVVVGKLESVLKCVHTELTT